MKWPPRPLPAVLALAAVPAAGAAGLAVLLRWQSRRMRALFDADAAGRAGTGTWEASGAWVAGGAEIAFGTPAAEELAVLAVLGDSWAAAGPVPTLPRLLGRGCARLLGAPVRVCSLAGPSARAEDIGAQVRALLADSRLRRSKGGGRAPRLAVLSMGTADLIHPISGSLSIPALTSAVNRLEREGGYTVFVLTCPNLGRLPGSRRPLRTVLRRSSRVLAGSQWLTALSAGAVPVSASEALRGTAQRGLIDASGRWPSALGRAQLAAAVLARIAVHLEAPVAVAASAAQPAPEEEDGAPQSAAAPDAPAGAAEPPLLGLHADPAPDSPAGHAAPAPPGFPPPSDSPVLPDSPAPPDSPAEPDSPALPHSAAEPHSPADQELP
ncbi:SGNH/GDSL hydrolase family protein [Brevibacterium sp. 5221]|uniref:SGNH/GDSL hydrolase family protein n=1 Tax=Brevibacterium rongguiense TaxID=2695267 RepID=A0A6N9H7U5_9MICO|nr:SGNH/GDSL hydrolase family protein [Brevibacterium rongguiense]MYM19642.1 SGNH/GDSL hydrolase family protein [Brevibacterium rongguiense]